MTRRWPVLGAIACLAISGCGEKSGKDAQAEPQGMAVQGDRISVPPDSPMLSQIRTVAVEQADMPTETVDAPGKIEADPNRMSHVVLPMAGRIASLMVHLGDSVQRGQTLLLVESPDADAAMANYMQSEASVNTAQSMLLKAQADAERSKDLFAHSAVAQKDVLTADSALAQAKASLDTAKAAREQMQRRLDLLGLRRDQFGQKLAVRAPISGKILEINVASNEYRNDTNASLMTIADLSRVWISSDVPETKIRLIRPGEEVSLELEAYPGKVFHARVARLADTVDPTTRTIKVHAEMANPGELLRPEMFGRIRHVDAVKPTSVVPLAAIVQGDGQNVVYRETGKGCFERVPVVLGERQDARVGILRGLKAGDRVVVDGVMLLRAS